jgi:hypothetical protein
MVQISTAVQATRRKEPRLLLGQVHQSRKIQIGCDMCGVNNLAALHHRRCSQHLQAHGFLCCWVYGYTRVPHKVTGILADLDIDNISGLASTVKPGAAASQHVWRFKHDMPMLICLRIILVEYIGRDTREETPGMAYEHFALGRACNLCIG